MSDDEPVDAIVAAEIEMLRYARWVDDEIAALTLERVTGVGGGWSDDSGLLGEYLRMRATFQQFPPARWARVVLEDGTDER